MAPLSHSEEPTVAPCAGAVVAGGTVEEAGGCEGDVYKRQSLFSVAGTERTLRAILRFQQESGTSIDGAGVVINKMRPDDSEHQYRRDEMRSLFGDLVAEPVLRESPVLQRAQGAAYPIHFWPDEESVVPRCV